MATLRDRLFALARLQRHHVVLDLNGGNGLLTWEAMRQVPEGSVYVCARSSADADRLQEQAAALPELMRPVVLQCSLSELPALLTAQASDIRFERIIGRNALIHEADKEAAVQGLAKLLQPLGEIILVETVPRYTQRLYHLLSAKFDPDLYQRWIAAEEAIYAQASDPMVNWDSSDLQAAFAKTGFTAEVATERTVARVLITPALLERWFTPAANPPSYSHYLALSLSKAEIAVVKDQFKRHLLNQTVTWESAIAFIQARH